MTKTWFKTTIGGHPAYARPTSDPEIEFVMVQGPDGEWLFFCRKLPRAIGLEWTQFWFKCEAEAVRFGDMNERRLLAMATGKR